MNFKCEQVLKWSSRCFLLHICYGIHLGYGLTHYEGRPKSTLWDKHTWGKVQKAYKRPSVLQIIWILFFHSPRINQLTLKMISARIHPQFSHSHHCIRFHVITSKLQVQLLLNSNHIIMTCENQSQEKRNLRRNQRPPPYGTGHRLGHWSIKCCDNEINYV